MRNIFAAVALLAFGVAFSPPASALDVHSESIYSLDSRIVSNASSPSFGKIPGQSGDELVLVYRDDSVGEPRFVAVEDDAAQPEPVFIGEQAPDWIGNCMWGGGYLVFCEVMYLVSTLPFLPPQELYGIYARDFYSNEEYYNLESTAPLYVRDTYGDYLVVESSTGAVKLIERDGPNLRAIDVVAGAGGDERQPVIGPGHEGKITVVYQDEQFGSWTINAWTWDRKENPEGRIIGTISTGANVPGVSDLDGYVILGQVGTSHIQGWVPIAEITDPGHPPIPQLPFNTPLNPAMHECSSLRDVKLGDEFALVRGEGCGSDQENKLFVVTAAGPNFVARNDVYQPLNVPLPGQNPENFGKYDTRGGWLAVELGGDIILEKPDPLWFHRLANLRDLTPWNLWAYTSGVVNYDRGQTYATHTIRVSGNRKYRLSVVSHYDCSEWMDDVRFYVGGDGWGRHVTDNEAGDPNIAPNCPVLEFGPFPGGQNQTLTVDVFRSVISEFGWAPPMNYDLFIEPLN